MTSKEKAPADDRGKVELSRSGGSNSDPTISEVGGKVKSDAKRKSKAALFTPIFDEFLDDLGLVTTAVYGVVWRYCQMDKGDPRCNASFQTIANRLEVHRSTAIRAIQTLCAKGYITDATPGRDRKPHAYKLKRHPQLVTLSHQAQADEKPTSTSLPLAGTSLPPATSTSLPLAGSREIHKETTEDTTLQDTREETTTGAGEKKRGDNGSNGDDAGVVADAFSQKVDLLKELGVSEPKLTAIANLATLDDVKGWCAYAKSQNSLTNPAGFVVSKLEKGEPPPEAGQECWYTPDDFDKSFVQPGERPGLRSVLAAGEQGG